MNLYIWYGVLCSYNCGYAYAHAESPERARQLLIESFAETADGSLHPDLVEQMTAELSEKPIVIEEDREFSAYDWGSA